MRACLAVLLMLLGIKMLLARILTLPVLLTPAFVCVILAIAFVVSLRAGKDVAGRALHSPHHSEGTTRSVKLSISTGVSIDGGDA